MVKVIKQSKRKLRINSQHKPVMLIAASEAPKPPAKPAKPAKKPDLSGTTTDHSVLSARRYPTGGIVGAIRVNQIRDPSHLSGVSVFSAADAFRQLGGAMRSDRMPRTIEDARAFIAGAKRDNSDLTYRGTLIRNFPDIPSVAIDTDGNQEAYRLFQSAIYETMTSDNSINTFMLRINCFPVNHLFTELSVGDQSGRGDSFAIRFRNDLAESVLSLVQGHTRASNVCRFMLQHCTRASSFVSYLRETGTIRFR